TVYRAGGGGAGDPVRRAGLHQHGREFAPAAFKGHDAAVREPWRFLVRRHRLHHGAGAGADAAQPLPRCKPVRGGEGGMSQSIRKPLVIVAAGGTGGHMVPAHAVAERLRAHGYDVALMTDERGLRYPGLFEGGPRHVLASGTLNGGIKGKVAALRNILAGTGQAHRIMQARRPAVVVGFGGYPALPALLAAISLRIPIAIHEQNAVLGRVNRLLARFTTLIATSFRETRRLKPAFLERTVLTGNPVRRDILALR